MKAYVTREYGADARLELAACSRAHRDFLMAESGIGTRGHTVAYLVPSFCRLLHRV